MVLLNMSTKKYMSIAQKTPQSYSTGCGSRLVRETDGPRKQPRASTSSPSMFSGVRSFVYHAFTFCFDLQAITKAPERMDACLCVQSAQNGLGDRIVLRVVRLRLVDHVGLLGPMKESTEAAAAARGAPRRPRVGRQLPHEATAEGILSSFFVDAFERFSSLRSAPRRPVYLRNWNPTRVMSR